MVFYRKYRPQTFTDIVGQTHVKQALAASLGAGSLAHAYLFCGPKGSGKTSTARILAKAVNCEKTAKLAKDQSVDPCNQCQSCLAITDGSHMDVIEIDAASNRGIDDIRSLQEKIMLAPVMGREKVYIIDEVHMLTHEAFNALLKTLEEPPAHVLIILATTEVGKLPQTIVSRCQRYTFQLASHEELHQALTAIIAAENITIAAGAIDLLIARAEGSFRDAEKMLDQAASAGSGTITIELIAQLFQGSQRQLATTFLTTLLAGDQTGALKWLHDGIAKGIDSHQFLLACIAVLRDVSYHKAGVSQVSDEADITEFAATITKPQLFALLKLLTQAEKDLRDTAMPALPIELAMFSWFDQLASDGDVILPAVKPAVANVQSERPAEKKTPKTEPTLDISLAAMPSVPQAPIISPLEAGAMIAETSDNIEQAVPVAIPSQLEPPLAEPVAQGTAATGSVITLKDIKSKWPNFIQYATEQNHSVALLLKNAMIQTFDGQKLTLEVFYKFHKERLENERNRRFAEQALTTVFGTPIFISCVFIQKAKANQTQEEISDMAMQIFSVE